MRRFNSKNGKPITYSNDSENSTDFFSKIETPIERERKKDNSGSPETSDANKFLKEDSYIAKGEMKEIHPSPKKAVGASLFSPENDINKNAEKVYISPFDENNIKKELENDNEEITQEERIISKNRFIFYSFSAIIIYLIILGIGYHYTSFIEDVPQIVTLEEREKQVYLSKADEYITTIQNIHADIMTTSDNYSENIIADAELERTMKTQREKIVKLQTELADLKAPDSYEKFQSQLNELYALQLTYCDNVTGFLKNKTDKNLKIVQSSNQSYEEKTTEFLHLYNTMFIN